MHMDITTHIAILILSGIILTVSASVIVRQATALAHTIGLSTFTVGFLFLGVMTSMPEIFVALQSARDGVPQLSAGNLLGGSILLLSAVMGMTAVFLGKITLDHHLSMREIWAMMGVIAIPALVLWDGSLTRPDGLLLITVYGLHALFLNTAKNNTHQKKKTHGANPFRIIMVLVAGLGGVFIASRLIVTSAGAIMGVFSIAPIVFGLFVLSLGTNLPEIALAIQSIRSRRREIAFGDFLGSSAANTLILGALALFSPFSVSGNGKLQGALILLFSVTIYFLWAVSSGRTITRKEGIGLLVFYLLFVLYELIPIP